MEMHHEKTKQKKFSKGKGMRLVGAILAAAVGSGVFGGVIPRLAATETVQAKTIGSKNEQACDSCNAVINKETPKYRDYSSEAASNPGNHDDDLRGQKINGKIISRYGDDGYSDEEIPYERLLEGKVYRGGNAKSSQSNANIHDNDPNDFASVLPYGSVYIDTSKMNFTPANKDNFIIDIKDKTNFVWATNAAYDTEDKEGHTPDLTLKGGFDSISVSGNSLIAYKGGIKAYLSETDAYKQTADPKTNFDWLDQPAISHGVQNIVDAKEQDLDYLYQFTFKGAATLPDGKPGDVVISTTKVIIEGAIDVDEGKLLGIQQANALVVADKLQDQNGTRYIPDSVSITPKNTYAGQTYNSTYWNGFGAQITFDIKVLDEEGKPVEGSISYSLNDLDINSNQAAWGRRSNTGDDLIDRMYAESMIINSGSLSYAVTPYYEHANADDFKQGRIADKNKVPVLVFDVGNDGSATADGFKTADGVKFSTSNEYKVRGFDGTLSTIWYDTEDRLTFWNGFNTSGSSAIVKDNYINKARWTHNQKTFEAMGYEWRDKLGSDPAGVYDKNTGERVSVLKFIQDSRGSYQTYRNDNSTYDSGFATLINSAGTNMTWIGSARGGQNMGTQLLDTNVFTHVEQSHGTGGGTYFETYNLLKKCLPTRVEGVSTMGKGVDATVTVVPEDGYRVKEIRVGGAGLSSTYTIANLTFDENNQYKDEANKVIIEKNNDGTYDVILQNMQEPRHVHADFTADYYFYKLWKNPDGTTEIPEYLTLKATNFIFEMTDVTLDGEKFTVSDHGTAFTSESTDSTYKLDGYILRIPDDTQTSGFRTYTLEGNKFTRTVNGEEKEYPINHKITSGDTKEFKVTAEKNEYVTVETQGNDTLWKIKYPADGRASTPQGAWPALPIGTNEDSVHDENHVERNYWFVTEVAPAGWSMVDYDNDKALAPGIVTASDAYKTNETSAENSLWHEQSIVYHAATEDLIRDLEAKDHAFMSPLSSNVKGVDGTTYTDWGGVITNYPAMVVKAEKEWDEDFTNDFNTRQDVLFHLDAVVNNKTITDFLAPIKIDKEATTTDALTGIWGNKRTYTTVDGINIIADASDLAYTEEKDGVKYEIPMRLLRKVARDLLRQVSLQMGQKAPVTVKYTTQTSFRFMIPAET